MAAWIAAIKDFVFWILAMPSAREKPCSAHASTISLPKLTRIDSNVRPLPAFAGFAPCSHQGALYRFTRSPSRWGTDFPPTFLDRTGFPVSILTLLMWHSNHEITVVLSLRIRGRSLSSKLQSPWRFAWSTALHAIFWIRESLSPDKDTSVSNALSVPFLSYRFISMIYFSFCFVHPHYCRWTVENLNFIKNSDRFFNRFPPDFLSVSKYHP